MIDTNVDGETTDNGTDYFFNHFFVHSSPRVSELHCPLQSYPIHPFTNKMRLTLALLFSLVTTAHSLYFLIKLGDEKCFVEEMPANTHAVASYVNADWSEAAGEKIHIKVTDVDDLVVHEQTADIEGRFAFTSTSNGLYQICLSVKTTKEAEESGGWFGKKHKEGLANRGEASHAYKFHLDIQVGEVARNYDDLMKKSHLTTMEVEVLKLTDRMKDTTRELMYQNTREEEFRNTSESTNARVMWWSIIQMGIMIVSAVFQSYHLKRFFEAKKLR